MLFSTIVEFCCCPPSFSTITSHHNQPELPSCICLPPINQSNFKALPFSEPLPYIRIVVRPPSTSGNDCHNSWSLTTINLFTSTIEIICVVFCNSRPCFAIDHQYSHNAKKFHYQLFHLSLPKSLQSSQSNMHMEFILWTSEVLSCGTEGRA